SVYPSLSDRSVVIHNPVASHIETHAKTQIKASVSGKYILCIGRLEEVKAVHYASEASNLISPKYPHLRLKCVGKGSLESKLRLQAAKFGISDKVDFEGFQCEVIPYYSDAALTLLTSKYEGFPNVLIESIVLGTPVVAFDCPSGPREILDYG